MATITPQSTTPPTEAQIEALVVMRVIKHATSTFPTTATGCLVGMDVGSQIQITNSFPFPAAVQDASATQDSYHQPDPSTLALAAVRAKSNVTYQNEMVKLLREVNVDAQNVGWYMSASMGNFVSSNFVENQFFFQKATDEKTVALVFDVSKSTTGGLSMKAYRLSPSFMASYKEGKFNTER
jgi:translation initiation factor 3 subunit H